jgi:hypothetical protein
LQDRSASLGCISEITRKADTLKLATEASFGGAIDLQDRMPLLDMQQRFKNND